MSVWLTRNKLFDLLWVGMLCLMLPACQHEAESVAYSAPIDPKIEVVETAPKALDTNLVVQQAAPLPLPTQSFPVSVPLVSPEELSPKLATQPPKLDNPSLAQPIALLPKRSGMSNALDCFLEHRNDEAITILRQYPTDDQDIAMVILPILAGIQNGETWASMNGPQKLALLESLRGLDRRMSKSAPLVMKHVAYVEEQPIRFGEVKLRANLNFYPQDSVFLYGELVNLVDIPNADEDYNVRLQVSLELVGSNGNTYWKANKPLDKQASITSRNDYHITAYFTLPPKVEPGSYTLVIHVLDRDSNRTARTTLPMQILDPKSKSTTPPKRKS